MGDFSFNNQKYSGERAINESEDFKARMNAIVRMCGQNKKLLDIGCFTGYLIKKLKQKNNEVYGVDISQKAVDAARKKGLNCFQGDVDKGLEFKDKNFIVFLFKFLNKVSCKAA